ncbi:hypothetical protein ACFXAZ_08425 [Streptomyces sp. NPDC059477]|uniref:hypothetical protein n=1 Tax=Streptomyces sp. NPDC059477 TaxID=3346847 RepID=UPI0036C5DCD5
MGVFARLLRRSKATEEVATEEASTTAAPAVEAAAETVVEKAGEAAEPTGSDEVATGEPAARDAGGRTTASVEIPKQQSAEQAADNDADEGART